MLHDEDLEKFAAERVMEWVEIIPQIHAPMVYYGKASDDPPICSCSVVKDNWHPLTDANQRDMVVDKMRELGYEVKLVTGLIQQKKSWLCQMWSSMDNEVEEYADTPAKAILAAAWAALEEK